jgi:hypothetical protein
MQMRINFFRQFEPFTSGIFESKRYDCGGGENWLASTRSGAYVETDHSPCGENRCPIRGRPPQAVDGLG